MREMSRTEMMELYGGKNPIDEGYEENGISEIATKTSKISISVTVTYYITRKISEYISRKRGQESYINSCQAGC